MHLIQGQLRERMGSGRSAWTEEESIKNVGLLEMT